MGRLSFPILTADLRDRANQERALQAIRTRYLLILGVWTFCVVTYLLWGMSYSLNAIHIVAGVILLTNTVAYSVTRRWELPLLVAFISTAADMVAITFLVYYTGGLSSIFFALYLIQILGVSLFLNLSFSALMVIWAILLVSSMSILESVGAIPVSSQYIPTTGAETTDLIIWLVFQAIMFTLVAFLGGNLSNKLKSQQQELEHKRDMEKTYAALEKANKSKARLLANVSHNLRTPLTSILGFSELLISGNHNEADREKFARMIHVEARHLAHLLSDTFYLSELQNDNISWNMTRADISQLTGEAAHACAEASVECNSSLELDIYEAPLPIYGDANRLRDVISRLIDNALKYTTAGTVVIKTAPENNTACFTISDTGIGIPVHVNEAIFEPMEEIYKTDFKTVPQRTGLSLAICRSVIQQHQGNIWFRSEPGKGSTFSFTLPLEQR